MPKQTITSGDTKILWFAGQQLDFSIVRLTADVEDTLAAANYDSVPKGSGKANAKRTQKVQIVLHCTADTNTAESTVNTWRTKDEAAHYVVEKSTSQQIARPALSAGSTGNDAGAKDSAGKNLGRGIKAFVDVIQCAPDDFVVHHAKDMANRNAIGIEHANIGPVVGNLLSKGKDNPANLNRFIKLQENPRGPGAAGGNTLRGGNSHTFQAYEDAQYHTMILLLRHLCITHRIPRRFLGEDTVEALRRWRNSPENLGASESADDFRGQQYEYLNFRGILSHHNVHKDKTCPGILHRNRLYRGLIDEWWFPIDLGEGPRPYYTGPFQEPALSGAVTEDFLFRWTGAAFEGTVYHDARLDPLYSVKSFYDLNRQADYIAACEKHGRGRFPVGLNGSWHGGVHLEPPEANPAVHAAASGTIIAARLTSHADTDARPGLGSQRFILIQHAVHLELQSDPDGDAGGPRRTRIDYSKATYIYTLYMHLDPVANLAAPDPNNPPWLNVYLREKPGTLKFAGLPTAGVADGNKGEVFAPNVEVYVGDVLASAGPFDQRRRVLHFEVFSGRQTVLSENEQRFGKTPWDFGFTQAHDEQTNRIADTNVVRVFQALVPFPDFTRISKTLHLSEWALERPEQLTDVVPAPERQEAFTHLERFSWVKEVLALKPELGSPDAAGVHRFFGGTNGIFWFLHPVIFMHHINDLVRRESLEVREIENADNNGVNVFLDEDGFITRFVTFDTSSSTFLATPADSARIKTWERSENAKEFATPNPIDLDEQQYHFSRQELGCLVAGSPHEDSEATPTKTHFALALLNFLEEVRMHFNDPLDVVLSHVCAAHLSAGSCFLAENGAHTAGVAIDVTPSVRTPNSCRKLWDAANTRAKEFNDDAETVCGNPAWGEIPVGYKRIVVRAAPTIETTLQTVPSVALDSAAAKAFRLHISLER